MGLWTIQQWKPSLFLTNFPSCTNKLNFATFHSPRKTLMMLTMKIPAARDSDHLRTAIIVLKRQHLNLYFSLLFLGKWYFFFVASGSIDLSGKCSLCCGTRCGSKATWEAPVRTKTRSGKHELLCSGLLVCVKSVLEGFWFWGIVVGSCRSLGSYFWKKAQRLMKCWWKLPSRHSF